MKEERLGKVTTDTVRKLVRLNLLTYRQVDSQHLQLTANDRSATVDLLTGHWESGESEGRGIFSLGRFLGLDEQAVLASWTKAAGGGR